MEATSQPRVPGSQPQEMGLDYQAWCRNWVVHWNQQLSNLFLKEDLEQGVEKTPCRAPCALFLRCSVRKFSLEAKEMTRPLRIHTNQA